MAGQPTQIPVIASAVPISTRSTQPYAVSAASARVSANYPVTVPAGATISLDAQGTNFYVIVTNGNLFIRPDNGVFSEYSQGTGENCGLFSRIELSNRNPYDVAALVFVGWDSFIDNRLIIAQGLTPNVALPTYSTPLTSNTVNINDLSGQPFLDINGKKWLALYRIAILVFNLDGSAVYLLQKKGATTVSGVATGAIYPLTPIRFDFSGDYCITTGSLGANINAVVSEIYSAIAA